MASDCEGAGADTGASSGPDMTQGKGGLLLWCWLNGGSSSSSSSSKRPRQKTIKSDV